MGRTIGLLFAKPVPENLSSYFNSLEGDERFKAPPGRQDSAARRQKMPGAPRPRPAASGRTGVRRLEREGDPVHAVAQAGRPRTVIEHMAEMAPAAPAVHFGALHEEAAVLRCGNGVRQGLIEARPAGAAVELGVRREHRESAARTREGALAFLVIERARERTLGALPTKTVELRGVEHPPPFVLRFLHLERSGGGRGPAAPPPQEAQSQNPGSAPQHNSSADHHLLPTVDRMGRSAPPE